MTGDVDLVRARERIDTALADLRGSAPPEIIVRVEELLADVSGLYGAGLSRVMDALAGDGGSIARARGRLLADPFVAALLQVHGLAPDERAKAEGLVPLRLGKSKGPPEPKVEAERCEMCGAPIAADHGHVARVETRELLCVCRACRLLFVHEGAAHGKFRPVSDRWVGGAALGLSDLAWARLGIPVRMAFFVADSQRGPVAFYPSPGGAIEAVIDDEAWAGVRSTSPALAELVPDVEAWLVDGRGKEGLDGFLVPIDACYELVARVRMHWRGMSGGDEARAQIDAFFANVRARVREGAP